MAASVRNQARKPVETSFPKRPIPIQIPLNFDLSLLEEHESLMDCIRHVAATCGVMKKNIARDMNWSKSQLSRFLNDNEESDPGHAFPLEMLPAFIAVTGSTMPIQWLALKFMQDPGVHKARALETIGNATRALERALAIVAQSANDD